MSFNKKIKNECLKKNNRLCIGLDVDNEKLTNPSLDYMEGFIKDIIDATNDICPVYKINFAFYERHGSKGFSILENIQKYIDNKAITIADAKRGDIGNSSKYYADAVFNHLNFDSITVAPYMGIDSINPFINYSEKKGVFILALTSNKGSENFQKLLIQNKELYKYVIDLSNQANINNNVGMVIGATNTSYLDDIEKKSSALPWLMPGIGFQGGDLKSSIEIGERNFLSLINVSRGIIYNKKGTINDIRDASNDYTKKIREYL
tara:strand:+ start:375 stop:1163 length:789 start_codon:yes stop_codon:yes gene_type:complete